MDGEEIVDYEDGGHVSEGVHTEPPEGRLDRVNPGTRLLQAACHDTQLENGEEHGHDDATHHHAQEHNQKGFNQ